MVRLAGRAGADVADRAPLTDDGRERARFRVTGVVQGVGFRPFVHRLAGELSLDGFVANDTGGVVAEVEGPAAAVDEFARRLVGDGPPHARVLGVQRSATALQGTAGFRIRPSAVVDGARAVVPPDLGLCNDCAREVSDPADRRFGHPLITCTNCGPRFTIVRALPYDRPNTTMAPFPMCAACAREYADPTDRRHHAQPLCCTECGPRLWLEHADGTAAVTGDGDCLAGAVAALQAGQVVAVKGIGGYHLAVRADDDAAVARLRDRKQRGDKPFAVLVRDLSWARRIARVDGGEELALTGPARPVVLMARRDDPPARAGLSPLVAPGNPLVGVMLASTGLHHLLVAQGPPVVVLTSGNLSEEPIVHRDPDARARLLGPLADVLLGHDRAICVPCDDSVVRVVAGEEVPIRRSRGHAPLPVRLPMAVAPVLAVGGEVKNTFCLGRGRDAWMSPHLGDMGDLASLEALDRTVAAMEEFHGISPERTVADLHPGYLTRRWAERRDPSTVTVQHHLAHVAAVMAEHDVDPATPVTGVAFDGTGYGTDGTIWGGELVCGTYATLGRVGHLAARPLPGADAAARFPARVAVSLLRSAGVDLTPDLPPVAAMGTRGTALLCRQLDRDLNCVPSSSMGRLVDAVASLLDVRHQVTYEAQAAMELEGLAAGWRGEVPSYRFGLDDALVAAPEPVIRAVVRDRRDGVSAAAVAAGFHAAVADLVVAWAGRVGLPTVALSGGVFQNAVLLGAATAALREAGHQVITHRLVPPNDGGLALGQVVLGSLAAPTAHLPAPAS